MDLFIPMEDVILTKRPITVSKTYYESHLKKVMPNLKLKFEDESTFFIDIYGTDEKTGKQKSNGQIRLQIDILPKELADMNKVGAARQEPNMNPYLPPPVGRLSLTLNPLKMFVCFLFLITLFIESIGWTCLEKEDLHVLLSCHLLRFDSSHVPNDIQQHDSKHYFLKRKSMKLI